MTPLQITQWLLEANYKYATTDIAPPAEMADFIWDWNKLNIPEDVLVIDEDDGKGREREPHVTVKYGLLAQEVPDELRQIAKNTPPFPVYLGRVSLFRNSAFDVVKLDVESPGLRELNRRVSQALPHEDTHPVYHPHLTLAYVEKGTCEHLVDDDPFKAEGVQREFIAYGMNFKGAGDDKDGRVKESLLFSKTKNPVAEAVVGASDREMAQMEQIIRSAAEDSNGDVGIFLALANEQLVPYRVKFAPHAGHRHGYAVATPEGVYLQVPDSQQLRSRDFLHRTSAVLRHELVHDQQMRRSRQPDEMYSKATAYVMPGGRVDPERYLKQKQEIMAWAASVVDSWRRQGLTTDQMMRRLRNGEWGFGMKYWHARHTHPQTFNRFVKQVTEYIEQLRESVFAETDAGLDPFGGCSFPADPDRIKQFLLTGVKRRGERPIL